MGVCPFVVRNKTRDTKCSCCVTLIVLLLHAILLTSFTCSGIASLLFLIHSLYVATCHTHNPSSFVWGDWPGINIVAAAKRRIWKENVICSPVTACSGRSHFSPSCFTRQIAVTVVDQGEAEQRLGRMAGFCLQSALPRLFRFLLKQWNPSAASHKNCKKANSRWRWMWNGPLDGAAKGRIMQPFRLSGAGAPFVPGADMLLHGGSWKAAFCSICLKATDLRDNLKTLDV